MSEKKEEVDDKLIKIPLNWWKEKDENGREVDVEVVHTPPKNVIH